MPINENTIINVTNIILGAGLIQRNFGIALWITDDPTLPASNPLIQTSNVQDIANAGFPETSNTYIAGQIYYAQDPYPNNLMIGRWWPTAIAGELVGGTGHATITAFSAISDGAFTINGLNVVGIDLTSAVSLSDVAAAVETQVIAAGLSCTVVYDSVKGAFVLTTTATGSTETLTFASAPTGAGTDLSTLLAWTSSTAQSVSSGQDAQTIAQAFANFQALDNIFYLVLLDYAYDDTSTPLELAAAIGTQPYFYFAESSDTQTLLTSDTTSEFYQFFQTQNRRVAGDWTPDSPTNPALYTKGLAVSSAARWSSWNPDGVNTMINPFFKQRPLIEPANLDSSEQAALTAKQVNTYQQLGGGTLSQNTINIYSPGYTFGIVSGTKIWQATTIFLDWLNNQVQLNYIDLQLNSLLIPRTQEGQTQISQVLESACQQGVTNGGLAPGATPPAMTQSIITVTGNSNFNGFLPLGYLVYSPPLATQNTNNPVQFYIWVTGSGAINYVAVTLTYAQ